MNFQKVQSGQKFKISAEEFNAFIEAALDLKKRQLSADDTEVGEVRPPMVHVRNDSVDDEGKGLDQPRFAILGLAGPLLTPTDNLREFQNRITFSGVSPIAGEHEESFVILAEPLSGKVEGTPPLPGRIGRGVIMGVSVVKILVSDESHTHAMIRNKVTTELASDVSRGSQVLWKESGVGSKWGIVRLSQVVVGEVFMVVREIIDGTNHWLKAQRVRPSDADPFDGTFIPLGEVLMVNTYPGTVAEDYRPFVFDFEVVNPDDPDAPEPDPTIPGSATILPAIQRDGAWWIKQRPKFRPGVRTQGRVVRLDDCRLVESIPT